MPRTKVRAEALRGEVAFRRRHDGLAAAPDPADRGMIATELAGFASRSCGDIERRWQLSVDAMLAGPDAKVA